MASLPRPWRQSLFGVTKRAAGKAARPRDHGTRFKSPTFPPARTAAIILPIPHAPPEPELVAGHLLPGKTICQ